MITPANIGLSELVVAIGALSAATTSAINVVRQWRNPSKIAEVHVAVNSRLTELLAAKDETMRRAVAEAAATAHAIGLELGRAQASPADRSGGLAR